MNKSTSNYSIQYIVWYFIIFFNAEKIIVFYRVWKNTIFILILVLTVEILNKLLNNYKFNLISIYFFKL